MRSVPSSRTHHRPPEWLEHARVTSRTGRVGPVVLREDVDSTQAEEDLRRADWERVERERVDREQAQREREERKHTEAHPTEVRGDDHHHETRGDPKWEENTRAEGPDEGTHSSDPLPSEPSTEERGAEPEVTHTHDRAPTPASEEERSRSGTTAEERAAPSHLAPAQTKSIRGQATTPHESARGAAAHTARQRTHRSVSETSPRRTSGTRR